MIEKIATPEVEKLIDAKRWNEIKEALSHLYPEDISAIISELGSASSKWLVFRLTPADKNIAVFENLSAEEQKKIIKSLSDDNLRRLLNEMAPDERTELFEDMPSEIVKKMIQYLNPEERKIAIALLGYPEDSVGRLVTPDFVQLYENMSVKEALEHIRKVGIDKETIYYCYVLDSQKRLIGIVPLKSIVLSSPQKRIGEIMNTDVIKVNAYTDREEAAKIFKRYDLLALPVVDKEDILLGIVTFDDFVDVLEEEATEDFEKIAAVVPVEKSYIEANFFEVIWKRSFWLVILLAAESLSGFVLQNYESAIQKLVALTFFLPILVDTGGNAGTQSATIIIRSLATGELRFKDFFRVVFREAAVGIFIGLILAIFGLIRAFLQKGNWLLSLSVGISIGLTVFLATTIGAVLPLIFKRLKLDPAFMSGPLITTIIDVIGIAVYFEIAQFFLNLK